VHVLVEDGDGFSINNKFVFFVCHGARIAAVGRVILEHVHLLYIKSCKSHCNIDFKLLTRVSVLAPCKLTGIFLKR